MRRKSRVVKIGPVAIGGNNPIAVQSMTNTETADVQATTQQIEQLTQAGCEIVRVAVPNKESVQALNTIKNQIKIPLVADVHFNWRLALDVLDQKIDKLRINPGNIGRLDRVENIVLKAKEKRIPIRIGVNAGSLDKKYENEPDPAEALVKSALEYLKFFESLDFHGTVLSVKSSSVPVSIKAYQLLAKKTSYPLHLGITEAGTLLSGAIKSAAGLAVLLEEGIGDTIRVSVAADPVREVQIGWQILQALGIRRRGPDLIACPTCGRCEIDLISLAEEIEERLLAYQAPLKVAVMGCVVNGPGEAKEADIGLAGGKGIGLLFRKGKPIRKVPESEMIEALMTEVEKLTGGKGSR